MLKVLIADPQAIFRSGLRHVIERAGDMAVVGETGSGHGFIELLRAQPSDLALVDPELPDLGGIDLLRQIKTVRPDLPILAFSMNGNGAQAGQLLRAGASGYLTKDNDEDMVLGAMRSLVGGGTFIAPDLIDRIACDIRLNGEHALHLKLSAREEQIFQMLVTGQSASEISQRLALNVKTVSTYKMRVMQKLNARNLVDLVRYATAQGLTAA